MRRVQHLQTPLDTREISQREQTPGPLPPDQRTSGHLNGSASSRLAVVVLSLSSRARRHSLPSLHTASNTRRRPALAVAPNEKENIALLTCRSSLRRLLPVRPVSSAQRTPPPCLSPLSVSPALPCWPPPVRSCQVPPTLWSPPPRLPPLQLPPSPVDLSRPCCSPTPLVSGPQKSGPPRS